MPNLSGHLVVFLILCIRFRTVLLLISCCRGIVCVTNEGYCGATLKLGIKLDMVTPMCTQLTYEGLLDEVNSEHPLSKAICNYARHFHFFEDPTVTDDSQNGTNEEKMTGWLLDTSDFCAIPGRGLQCCINEKQILVGNRALLEEKGVMIPTDVEDFVVDLEENAKTCILVAYDSKLIGVVGVADPLKREAAVVVEGLFKMGVRSIMVTGDNWRTARAVAKEAR